MNWGLGNLLFGPIILIKGVNCRTESERIDEEVELWGEIIGYEELE